MEREIVTLEVTIDKSHWVDIQSLMNKIKDSLKWSLATGGCKILDIKVKEPSVK